VAAREAEVSRGRGALRLARLDLVQALREPPDLRGAARILWDVHDLELDAVASHVNHIPLPTTSCAGIEVRMSLGLRAEKVPTPAPTRANSGHDQGNFGVFVVLQQIADRL
jgi:hypothetical protein